MDHQDLIDNLAIIENWGDARWATWLVHAFRRNETKPLWLDSHSDLIREIDRLFIAAEEPARRTMKDGVVQAIREWDADLYAPQSFRILQQLSWTASRLRATDVVPHLVALLIRYCGALAADHGALFTAMDSVAAVLAGFAPDEEIERVFDLLLFDRATPPALSSTLAVGLCLCDTKRFPETFARYYEQRQKVTGYFRDAEVVANFEAAVTHRGVMLMLKSLPATAQRYFVRTALAAGLMTHVEAIGFDDDRGKSLPVEPQSVAKQTSLLYEEVRDHACRLAKNEIQSVAGVDIAVTGTDLILAGLQARADRVVLPESGGQYGRAQPTD